MNFDSLFIVKTNHTKSVLEMKSLCAETRPEDGIPPHVLKKQQRRGEQPDHGRNNAHAAQYCKAAHRSLEAGLASVCGDPRLKDLSIATVEPLRTGSHLLVVVTVPAASAEDMLELERALQKAAGLLRSVIATEIQRKRTPHLTFRVVPEIR